MSQYIRALLFFPELLDFPSRSVPLYFLAACALSMSITRLSFYEGPPFKSPIILPRQRNTRSETVRAEVRAVTESVARSRALYLCLSLSIRLSLALPCSLSLSWRTFPISLARNGMRKNVPRSVFLYSLFHSRAVSILLTFSLLYSSFLLYLPSSSRSHASPVPFHLAK